jgi:hypothetical protein
MAILSDSISGDDGPTNDYDLHDVHDDLRDYVTNDRDRSNSYYNIKIRGANEANNISLYKDNQFIQSKNLLSFNAKGESSSVRVLLAE